MSIRLLLTSAAVFAFSTAAQAQVAPAVQPAAPAASLSEALAKSSPILEMRLRYEGVDQTHTARLTEDAEALTLRSHLGFRTGAWRGLQLLVEGSNVARLGPEHYAVNVPGSSGAPLNGAAKARYPVINDPSTTELNRAQLTWTLNNSLSTTVGRQRLIVDDQRFVGNVGWRQDEQTFDAARVDLEAGKATFFYAYVDRVNRVLGKEKDWDTEAHLLNGRYDLTMSYALEGFVYLLDAKNAAANSSKTAGVRATGRSKLGPVALAYEATFAHQSDYRNQPTAFGLDFYDAAVAGTYKIATLRLDYQSLGGDGRRGFTTPLATTHAFNGWSDAFATPDGNKGFIDGLGDYSAALVLRPKWRIGKLTKPEFTVIAHQFDDRRFNSGLGREWDLMATVMLADRTQFLVKYANYERPGSVPLGAATPPASRSKLWFSLEFKL